MAGRIPKPFIDEIILRTDIVDVIDTRVPLKKAGKDYKACCPFHEEKTPSFTVSPDKQFYHCFGCGAHGTAIGFLMEYERMSFQEAVEDLARRAGLTVPYEGGAAPAAEQGTDLLDVSREAARYYRAQLRDHPQAVRAVEYLKERGVTGEIAKEFELGFAPDGWDNLLRALGKDEAAREMLARAGLAVKKEGGGYYDRFRNRIMFPIHDYRGRIVGFGGRVLGKEEPKYLNSPETPLFHKGRELYGLFRARDAIKREGRALVVEGYMDVVALTQYGVDNAVATLGTATTRDHLERLFRYTPEVVFCFDGDRAGREAAWRALETALPALHDGRQASFLFLPEGEDPDTLVRKEGREAFLARLATATALPDFLFGTLVKQVDLGRMDGRARLVELARPLLSKLPHGVLHQMMLERLGELSQVNSEKLATLVVIPDAAAPARQEPRSTAGPKEPPSVARLAIAMLLQQPELAAKVPDEGVFADLDLPGMALFRAILQLLKTIPNLNTAAIIEHFRDTEHQAHLEKLAVWRHPALEHDVGAEFAGVIEQFRRVSAKVRTEQLLQKQRFDGLTSDEKAELAHLLSKKRRLDDFSSKT
ncbi:MAG: DNA primase [Candidatus Muproteobacteria bacterium RBG_16_65_34]|uniref:DNA primase n=1 Tax=Candidatus Muproteobacteria bacterium RBG_16_65_34 TaxID=1817760 RepID=A0A1F6TMR8_9PROT|nr:MAG: DNA primase [Candidatus Muproteobacteria bacterium RBG_16_65_34]